MDQVYLSYSLRDKEAADAIYSALEQAHISVWMAPRNSVWMAPRNDPPHVDEEQAIIRAIDAARVMVVVFSVNAENSPEIKREVEHAERKCVFVLPVRIDHTPFLGSFLPERVFFDAWSPVFDEFAPTSEYHLDKLACAVKWLLPRARQQVWAARRVNEERRRRRLESRMIEEARAERLQRETRREASARAMEEAEAEAERKERERKPKEAPKGVDYPVWFATNRKQLTGGGFSGERGHDQVTRGRIVVHVPKAHRFGESGSGFWKRLWRGDDRLRMKEIVGQAFQTFNSDVRETLKAAVAGGDEPQALVFLHGYNVSFEEAAIRAAQIGYDLKVPGPVAFFSWPSRGDPLAYPADEASIEASEGHIADFLVEFAQNCKLDGNSPKLHFIAHSMGNRGFLRALQRIAANAEARGKVHFNQIVLAAPDVDRDLFLDLAALYRMHADRVTLYASRRDLAVHLSSKLHDAPRAGYFTPFTVTAGIDTIAVPDFDVDLLRHSYFAQAEALLHDIFDLMHLKDEQPRKRQRVEPMEAEGKTFWTLRR